MRTQSTLTMLAVALAAGCASTSSQQPSRSGSSYGTASVAPLAPLAKELFDDAALRADTSKLRVCVPSLDGRDAGDASKRGTAVRDAEMVALSRALEHELLFALSERMHVLDKGIAPASNETHTSVDEMVAATGASHAVVGHFVRLKNDNLQLSVRLVDAETGWIVASAQESVAVQDLVDRGAMAWADIPEPEPELAPVAVEATRDLPVEAAPAPAATRVRNDPVPRSSNAPRYEYKTEPAPSSERVAAAAPVEPAAAAAIPTSTALSSNSSANPSSSPASSSKTADPTPATAKASDAPANEVPVTAPKSAPKHPVGRAIVDLPKEVADADGADAEKAVAGPASIRLGRLKRTDNNQGARRAP